MTTMLGYIDVSLLPLINDFSSEELSYFKREFDKIYAAKTAVPKVEIPESCMDVKK